MVFSKAEGIREKGKDCQSHVFQAWAGQSLFIPYRSRSDSNTAAFCFLQAPGVVTEPSVRLGCLRVLFGAQLLSSVGNP